MTLYERGAAGFRACPCCGKADKLEVTSERLYQMVRADSDNGEAPVSVRCQRCSLELWDHSYAFKDYDSRISMLRLKWNGMGNPL
jgi:hypothetical protein